MKEEENGDYGPMLVVFREVAEGLVQLGEDDRHKIVDSVLDWYAGGTGEVDGLTPTAALVSKMIRDKQLAYAALCRKRSEAGVKSGEARRGTNSVRTKSNSMSMSTSKSKSASISKSNSDSMSDTRPTLEDVRTYCQERGNKVDPQAWYDYYTANGWKVGRNQMKDWRAAVRTWERNGVGAAKSKSVHGDNYIGATENQVKEFSDGFAA